MVNEKKFLISARIIATDPSRKNFCLAFKWYENCYHLIEKEVFMILKKYVKNESTV